MALEQRFVLDALETAPSQGDAPGIIKKTDGSVVVVDGDGDEVLTVGPTGEISMVLPTSDPTAAGQLWASSGVVTVSAG
jgi:hypothetical protein